MGQQQEYIREDTVIGKHVYGNLYGCDPALLNDEERLVQIAKNAVKVSNAKLWEVKSWKFGGRKGGVSVIALVLESHIAIHTWNEYNYATVDVFTCGSHTDPEKAFDYILSELKPKDYIKHRADRSLEH